MDDLLTQANTFENQGLWTQAIACYQQYLAQQPDNPNALHALSIVAVKAQDYDIARTALASLTQLQPDSAIYQNHYGNVLKQLGHVTEAEQAYTKAIQAQPEFVEALNNLGTLYYQQADYQKAEHFYQQALKKSPEYIDAWYNLGICQHKQHHTKAAIESFQTLLNITPNHLAAHYQLGKLYLAQNETHKAVQAFETVIGINDKIPEVYSNLGNCFLKQENYQAARLQYEKSLDLEPNNFEAQYNLAIVSEHLANLDLAIQHYQKALQLNPEDFAAHNNIGIAYLKRQNLGYALSHLEKALSLQPDNDTLRYNVNAIKQDKRLEAAPTNYIKNLFDAYAQNFETHIQDSLDYQVPEQVLSAASQVRRLKKQAYVIGDLGCGTGLAGKLFKPYAKRLVGVDLSDKMIEVAAEKNIYDDLTAMDIHTYLKPIKSTFDFLLAADVFVYIGNLDEIIAACHQALTRKGCLIFSTEICHDQPFKVLPSGRFAHSESYLIALAKQHRFNIIFNHTLQARMQYDEPVMARLLILEKRGFLL